MKQKLKEIPSGPFALGQEASLMKRNHQYFGIFLSSYLHHHKHGLHAESNLAQRFMRSGKKWGHPSRPQTLQIDTITI